MANVIKLKSGDSGDNPASDSLVRGEVAIRHVAGDHTASSSSKLYFGEAQGSGSVTLRQFGFGIAGDSGQHGIAIGENFTITGGNALTTVVSGDAVTINHDDTSSQASSNNSGTTFIQDITLDTYGHVTGIGTATASGGSSISFGSDNQIPFQNSGGDDFDYSANFTFDGTDALIASTGKLQFRDSAISINSSADQYLDINSDRYVRVNVDNSDNSGAFIIMDSTESSPTQKIYMYPDDNPTMRLDANGGTFGQLETRGGHLYLTSADDIYLGGDGTNGTTTVDDIHINVGDGHVLNFDEDGTTRATFNLDSTPELDVTGDFTIDCSADIILDADGSQIYFKDDTTERFRFNLDSTPEMDVTGAFTIDCTDDIILDAGGEDITFKDAGNTRINFDLDSTPTMDVTGAFDIKSSSNITLDATGDITLSADGDQINMDDGSTTRFTFNVDSTPEIDVTGAFTIDCSSTIELDATGGTMLTEASDSSATGTLMRPVAFAQDSSILMGGSIQYYPSSTDTITIDRSSDPNDDVYFLPFNCHGTMSESDEPEHYFYAPANGHFIAITAVSNNPLHRPDTSLWRSKIQILEATGTGGGSNKFGTVDGSDTRLAAAEDANTNEIQGIQVENGNSQKVIYHFSQSGTFRFTAGKIYAFGFRQDQMGGASGTSASSKSHTIHLNYILSYDETTSGSGYGGWTGL